MLAVHAPWLPLTSGYPAERLAYESRIVGINARATNAALALDTSMP
jgi:hypothetical protein